jgi:hypothetical protein
MLWRFLNKKKSNIENEIMSAWKRYAFEALKGVKVSPTHFYFIKIFSWVVSFIFSPKKEPKVIIKIEDFKEKISQILLKIACIFFWNILCRF